MGSLASFFILPFAALFLLVNKVEGLPNCASGWIRKNNTCYKAFNTTKTWQEAQRECEVLTASLPIVLSSEENKFLGDVILKSSSWIGASTCREDEFCWPDGSTVPKSAAWNKGEPSRSGSSKACVEMILGTNVTGKWNDVSCAKKKPFICTRVLPEVPSLPEVIHVNPTSIIVMWDPPAPRGPQVSQYFVMYREKEGEQSTTLTVPGNKTRTRITGLMGATEYVVRVKTGNDAGNSTAGPMRSFNTTHPTRPSPAIVDLSVFQMLKKTDSFSGYHSQLVLFCTATGRPPLTFTWIQNNHILQTENDSPLYSDKLVLSGDLDHHVGQITCRVTNLEGNNSRNIDIQASNAEAFSVTKTGGFQTVLVVLVLLVITLVVIVFVFFRRRRRGCSSLRHIKVQSMKIKSPRGKDYTDPPATVELSDITASAKPEDEINVDEKEVKDPTSTEYYMSLQRNEDGTLNSGHPEAQEMDNNLAYGIVDATGGYPASGGASYEEESYPHRHPGYPDSHQAFGYEEGYRDSSHSFHEGNGYPYRDQTFAEGDGQRASYHAFNEDGYPPSDQAFVNESSYQPLGQGHVDAGSYEKLGEIAGSHNSNHEGPMYGNCLDEQYPPANSDPQNDEFPIYSNC